MTGKEEQYAWGVKPFWEGRLIRLKRRMWLSYLQECGGGNGGDLCKSVGRKAQPKRRTALVGVCKYTESLDYTGHAAHSARASLARAL